jgi:hypothetical protein
MIGTTHFVCLYVSVYGSPMGIDTSVLSFPPQSPLESSECFLDPRQGITNLIDHVEHIEGRVNFPCLSGPPSNLASAT